MRPHPHPHPAEDAREALSSQLADHSRQAFTVAIEGLAEASRVEGTAPAPRAFGTVARAAATFAADAVAHLEREELILAPLLRSRRYVLTPPVLRILCAEHLGLAAARAAAHRLAARLPKDARGAEPACTLLAHLDAATQAFAEHLAITDLLFSLVLRLERDGASR